MEKEIADYWKVGKISDDEMIFPCCICAHNQNAHDTDYPCNVCSNINHNQQKEN